MNRTVGAVNGASLLYRHSPGRAINRSLHRSRPGPGSREDHWSHHDVRGGLARYFLLTAYEVLHTVLLPFALLAGRPL